MNLDWNEIEKLVQDIVENQKKQLLKLGRHIIPSLTPEDMLQPNDYSELENHPYFRYEEGILAGMQSIQSALRASHSDKEE